MPTSMWYIYTSMTLKGDTMKTVELKIEGMTCSHCVMHVKQELSRLPHVQVDDVGIGNARVQYDESKLSMLDFANAIDRAGYKLIP